MTKRSPTTKDIGLLKQLHDDGQLTLAAEFQRNSVWPRPAKAYLIDTILNDRPIPLMFFQRGSSAQTGKPSYAVIDGQQRLRAIFEFLDDRFRLTETDKKSPFYNRLYSELETTDQETILNYDLVVQELSAYDEDAIKDIFVRMNKYVVKLSPQELRHARATGKFSTFVETIGKWAYWRDNRIFSKQQIKRMRPVEFAAELAILLIEGPQDKKAAIDLYYHRYQPTFPKAKPTRSLLRQYLTWVETALPDLADSRYRSPTDFYSLMGALHDVSDEGKRLSSVDAEAAGDQLREFGTKTRRNNPSGDAARYVAAASRQTDNIQPRTTRIEILGKLLNRA
jgi:hypothetical protein